MTETKLTKTIVTKTIAPLFANVKQVVGGLEVWIDEDGDQAFGFFHSCNDHNNIVWRTGYIIDGKVYNQFNNMIGEL